MPEIRPNQCSSPSLFEVLCAFDGLKGCVLQSEIRLELLAAILNGNCRASRGLGADLDCAKL